MKLNRRHLARKRNARIAKDCVIIKNSIGPGYRYTDKAYVFRIVNEKVPHDSKMPYRTRSVYRIYFRGRRGLLVPIKDLCFKTMSPKASDLILECRRMAELMVELNVTNPNDIDSPALTLHSHLYTVNQETP